MASFDPNPNPNREYPYEGVVSGALLRQAFWLAAARLGDDPTVHDMEKPYLDPEMGMIDTSGGGMPQEFWDHMAKALAEE